MRFTAAGAARGVVCVSVCVFGKTVSCAKTAEPIEMPFGRQTRVGQRNHVLKGGPDTPQISTFEWHIYKPVASALRIDCLPLREHVSAQRTPWTSASAAARNDKTAMRPFAKLRWTPIITDRHLDHHDHHYHHRHHKYQNYFFPKA